LKRLILVSLLVLVAAFTYRFFGSAETATGTLTLTQPAPAPGDRAPGFTTRTAGGEPFTLSDRGVYVLAFWSTLNQGSNNLEPGFKDLANEYANDEASFGVVYVNSTPEASGAPYATLRDGNGKLASRYNVKRVPRIFLIKGGDVELVWNGYYEGIEDDLQDALEEAVEDKS
jgi:AhpC/TSA family